MAILSLQDRIGKIDCVIFSDAYQRCAHLLQQDSVVLVVGRVDRSRGELQLLIDNVTELKDASTFLAKRIELTFCETSSGSAVRGQMELVSGLIKQAGSARVSSGALSAEVVVHINTEGKVATLLSKQRVVVEPKLVHQISEVIGHENVRLFSISKN